MLEHLACRRETGVQQATLDIEPTQVNSVDATKDLA